MMRLSATGAPVLPLSACVLAAVVFLAGCAGHGGVPAQSPTGSAAAPDYILGPGDQLSINVYQLPDLTMTLPVRPDGRISMPLVVDMQAAGKTPTQLGHDIADKLKDYVKDANVTVIVTGFNGPFDRQIKVIGEAAQPMALPYTDNITLLDVMIAAKGLTRFAAGNRAEIVRRHGGKTETIPVRLGDLMRDGDISQNVTMQPGDTLIIPQTWF